MRSENEIRENLEWLKSQCLNFKDNEAEPVIRQLEVLLWVLGQERNEAEAEASSIWKSTRIARGQNPQNYG